MPGLIAAGQGSLGDHAVDLSDHHDNVLVYLHQIELFKMRLLRYRNW